MSSENFHPEWQAVNLQSGYGNVTVCNIGASITAIHMPDKNGKLENIVLRYDRTQDYLSDPFYIGATVGRVAGRIAGANFHIGEKKFCLSQNDVFGDHLHGGYEGFNHKIFTVGNVYKTSKICGVDFHYLSKDGEEGYPGNLYLKVAYLFSKNKLSIVFEASTNHITPANFTNHAYFNLSGNPEKALEQELFISATKILETDNNYLPTGKMIPVKGTAYDFRQPVSIILQKSRIFQKGFNDYYILDNPSKTAAIVYDPSSGRRLSMATSYPGILFYSGEYLGGTFTPCQGICLEAQHYSDAVNHAHFPGVLLQPGQLYRQHISYTFSV